MPTLPIRCLWSMATLTLVPLSLAASYPVSAQFGGLGKVLKAAPGLKAPNILSGPQPITTNIRDAVYGDPARDGFVPPMPAKPLTGLNRTPEGGFVLASGYYELHAQSYCLHAGTHGPGGGDGYLYAPVKGSAEDAVTAILRNANAHPEIAQRDIQQLLWAIVARAKLEDLSTSLKLVAGRLLTTQQLARLNRNALSVLSSPQLAKLTGGQPPLVRQVVEAESRMRSMLTTSGSTYADLERVAVLSGAAPVGEGSVQTPNGRWNAHPDGYLVRYQPSGYAHTLIQIWVAPGSAGIGKVFDPATQIAVPGNTARQRLAQSGRVYANP